MSHGIDTPAALVIDPDTPAFLQPLARALQRVNQAMVALGMVALLIASVVLTYSVVSRYVLKASTDWQDEAAVFCLVGATFLCGAFVQALRGHVGIEAVAGLLPSGLNRLRLLFVDLLSAAFCAFFSWKSWTLFHEALVEGQDTLTPEARSKARQAAGMESGRPLHRHRCAGSRPRPGKDGCRMRRV